MPALSIIAINKQPYSLNIRFKQANSLIVYLTLATQLMKNRARDSKRKWTDARTRRSKHAYIVFSAV